MAEKAEPLLCGRRGQWRQVHPREEHLVPLFVALGAAGPDAVVAPLFEEWCMSLAMHSYRFDDPSSSHPHSSERPL
jgi:aromatic ring-opening dioxygenase catalytic subunit (LigB family)